MKNVLLTITAIVFTVFSLNAQEKKELNTNAPKIEFEKVIYDYGTIYQGSNGTCYFEFKNVGKEPLILSKPRSSCGCTVPTWPKKPILPGKSDKIKVTYNTKRAGIINKTVTVYSNAINSSIVLRIKGKVIAAPKEQLPIKKTDKGATPINK